MGDPEAIRVDNCLEVIVGRVAISRLCVCAQISEVRVKDIVNHAYFSRYHIKHARA